MSLTSRHLSFKLFNALLKFRPMRIQPISPSVKARNLIVQGRPKQLWLRSMKTEMAQAHQNMSTYNKSSILMTNFDLETLLSMISCSALATQRTEKKPLILRFSRISRLLGLISKTFNRPEPFLKMK